MPPVREPIVNEMRFWFPIFSASPRCGLLLAGGHFTQRRGGCARAPPRYS